MAKKRGAPRTEKYAKREKRVSKSGKSYYYYYEPIFSKMEGTPYGMTRTAIRRLALFAKKYKKVKSKDTDLTGLALFVYMARRGYPVRRIGEAFGFSHNYAHRNVKYVRWLHEEHGMFNGHLYGGN